MVEVLGEDHRDREQEQADREEAFLGVELEPEDARPGDVQDAVRPARVVPVVERDPGHLAEAQGHDGEVVAAQAQRRVAEDGAGGAGEDHGQRQRGEEVQVGLGHQERARVGADGEERRIAQVQEPGVADHDVEAEPEHRVRRHGDRDRGDVGVAV